MWCGVIPAADIRYAKSGKVSLAYQTFGAGDTDLVLAPGYISNLEANWEEPNYARFLERVALTFRVVIFDKRGTGLSDRIPAATKTWKFYPELPHTSCVDFYNVTWAWLDEHFKDLGQQSSVDLRAEFL